MVSPLIFFYDKIVFWLTEEISVRFRVVTKCSVESIFCEFKNLI